MCFVVMQQKLTLKQGNKKKIISNFGSLEWERTDIFSMNSEIDDVFVRSSTTITPLIDTSKKCSDVDLNKALAVLGFGSWNAVESSKNLRHFYNPFKI